MIRYLVMDVDGTLTDGRIYMGPAGEAMKAFNIKDGCGINVLLPPSHITPMIITGRSSDIVLNRCRELGITKVYQGVSDKVKMLEDLVPELESVAYIGDDINDLPCMSAVKAAGGIVGCPADAANAVKAVADYVAKSRGGDGAVRDFIEWLVSAS